MRMFSGLGGPEGERPAVPLILSHGETGLSVAFHYPTLMDTTADCSMSKGEIGNVGAVDTLQGMEILFEGIPLTKVTTSMTNQSPGFQSCWNVHCRRRETGGEQKGIGDHSK